MRIAIANDASGFGGGVDTYLDGVLRMLHERSHELAFVAPFPHRMANFPEGVSDLTAADSSQTVAKLRRWKPDICFSQNMSDLTFEQALIDTAPTVKFMHGYHGTCISAQKTMYLPHARPCDRTFGRGCIAAYLPRRCGNLSITELGRGYRWSRQQSALLSEYRYIVVASQHMAREYSRHGVPDSRLVIDPLFSTMPIGRQHQPDDRAFVAVFFGRMTKLKGGDFLLRAVAEIQNRSAIDIRVVMAGDGPSRFQWMKLAKALGVEARFPGWVNVSEREAILRTASVMVIPSVWPEPFGLTGLEAAGYGVPSVAFDVGGVSQWLTSGVNGLLVSGSRPTASNLAAALQRLIDDRPLLTRMRDGARRAASQWTLARHILVLEEVFQRAFDEKQCGESSPEKRR